MLFCCCTADLQLRVLNAAAVQVRALPAAPATEVRSCHREAHGDTKLESSEPGAVARWAMHRGAALPAHLVAAGPVVLCRLCSKTCACGQRLVEVKLEGLMLSIMH